MYHVHGLMGAHINIRWSFYHYFLPAMPGGEVCKRVQAFESEDKRCPKYASLSTLGKVDQQAKKKLKYIWKIRLGLHTIDGLTDKNSVTLDAFNAKPILSNSPMKTLDIWRMLNVMIKSWKDIYMYFFFKCLKMRNAAQTDVNCNH